MRISPKGRKHHDTILRKKYGIGLHQYQSILEAQQGACGICGKKNWRNLAIDHNHQTGDVRGLLCSTCNTGLGQFQDSVDLLEKAIEYLKRQFTVPSDVRIEPVGKLINHVGET